MPGDEDVTLEVDDLIDAEFGDIKTPSFDRRAATSFAVGSDIHTLEPSVCSSCAGLGMAIAHLRNDGRGEGYRDLLEQQIGEVTNVAEIVAAARLLFPDVPVSQYTCDELTLDDLSILVRTASQRNGRLIPVLFVDAERLRPGGGDRGLRAIVLPGLRDRVGPAVAAAYVECVIAGWLPPL